MTQTPMAQFLVQRLGPPPAATGSAAFVRDALLVTAFSLVTALSAQIAVPLPGSPVPLTGQTFGVLLSGALLGPRLGAMAMLLYLAEGGFGLPFFAGGASGPAHLLGPTGGYLLSYPLAAWITGTPRPLRWTLKPFDGIPDWAPGGSIPLGTISLRVKDAGAHIAAVRQGLDAYVA